MTLDELAVRVAKFRDSKIGMALQTLLTEPFVPTPFQPWQQECRDALLALQAAMPEHCSILYGLPGRDHDKTNKGTWTPLWQSLHESDGPWLHIYTNGIVEDVLRRLDPEWGPSLGYPGTYHQWILRLCKETHEMLDAA